MLAAPELDLFSLVVDRLNTGVIVISENLAVLYANRAAQRALHPERLRKDRPLPIEWGDFALRAYAETLFKVRHVPSDELVRQEGERVFHVSASAGSHGKPGVLLVEDVSAADRRRRAERDFVANAAHELLTPLTGIISAAHVLEEGAKGVPEDRDRFIAHIARECDRLAHIARALLVLARAQSGEQPPRLEIVTLCQLLERTVENAIGGLPVTARIDCADDITVFADADLLEQALRNLLVNALKHGSGGDLHVTAERLGEGKVTIVVAEPGGTAAAAALDRARRFYRPGGPDSDGFGLGVSIARQSLGVLGGTLTYEIAVDRAPVARIELPSGYVGSA